jgi:hypothetical protein
MGRRRAIRRTSELADRVASMIQPRASEPADRVASPMLLLRDDPVHPSSRCADRWQVTGLIDFGDVWCGAADYDLLGPATFLAAGDPVRLGALLAARGYSPDEVVPALRVRLMALLLLHRHSDLDVQLRIPGWRERAHSLDELAAIVFPLPRDRGGQPVAGESSSPAGQ